MTRKGAKINAKSQREYRSKKYNHQRGRLTRRVAHSRSEAPHVTKQTPCNLKRIRQNKDFAATCAK